MTTLELTVSHGDARRADRLAQWTRVLCVLFFFSGFPALIYQLTWQRALFRIFGVNIESVTIVVTAFMLGLGLGSLAGGWLSKRRGIPLLPLLAAIELMTGTFGLVSLGIFDRVGQLIAGASLTVTAGVSLALVMVPTLLMGATLPLLVCNLVRRSGKVGTAVGLLYYVNTLGAGAACLVCAVVLFPFAGMQGAVYVAAAINGAVALGALFAHRYERLHPAIITHDAPASFDTARPILRLGAILGLAATGGFISLSYEIFFFRIMSFAGGSSATSFALTLSVFLIGIASGSRQAGQNCAHIGCRWRRRGGRRLNEGEPPWSFCFCHCSTTWRGSARVFWRRDSDWSSCRSLLGLLLPCLAELGVAAETSRHAHSAFSIWPIFWARRRARLVTGFVLADYVGLVGIGVALVVASLVVRLPCWLLRCDYRVSQTVLAGRLCGGARFAGDCSDATLVGRM